ncbi:hypothetical protein [Lysinibacillus xylanilyticus]|uniref:hypothetical protein n=1 Tax=Lysinibacillus xylanilyticus TaxID=582475 RepID=UPI0037F1CD69
MFSTIFLISSQFIKLPSKYDLITSSEIPLLLNIHYLMLSVRKRSGSNKCFICAKAKRQRQMFYLRESEAAAANVFCSESKATATNVFCAKAKRQRQMFSARKRSGSDKSAQPERKSTTRYGDEPYLCKALYLLRIHVF